MESGIRLTTKTGSGIKILIVFGIRDQHFGQKYGISYEKIYLVTTLICTVLIASMKLSVDCSLCRDSSVRGLRMLVKCLES